MSDSLQTPALALSEDDELAMLDEAQLHARLLTRVDAAWQLAREVHPELPCPRVWFDLKGRSAGQAHYARGGLRFNAILLRDNRRAFMDEIVPHEMAHWLVFHLEGGAEARPHGREWQGIMRRLYGLAPVTTHRFDVSRASPMPYLYRCGCETPHHFSARRHSLACRGSQYRCRRCRARLVFDGVSVLP